MMTGAISSYVIHGIVNAGKPCGNGPSTDTPARSPRSSVPTIIVAPTTATRMPGMRCPDGKRGPIRLPRGDRSADRPQVAQGTVGVYREAEQFWGLADQHRQRDAI